MSLSLRRARQRLLHHLRQQDVDTRPALGAARAALLRSAPLPRWIDQEALDEHAQDHTRQVQARHGALQAAHWLRRHGLTEAAHQALNTATQALGWRMAPDSPDALQFRGAVTDILSAARAVKADTTDTPWSVLALAIVPDPEQNLADLWDTPLEAHGRTDTTGGMVADLEDGAQTYTLVQELLLACPPGIPADARTPAFQALACWARWVTEEQGLLRPGHWVAPILHTPIQRLMGVYGNGHAATGMRAAMAAVAGLLEDIDTIGGARRVYLWHDNGHNAAFSLTPKGAILGDNPHAPWAALTMRSALGLALLEGGAIFVERQRALSVEGQPSCEIFAGRLEEGSVDWFNARACAAIFAYDYTTGHRLPHQPGRVYRSGPRAEA